jgi:putative membrane protein
MQQQHWYDHLTRGEVRKGLLAGLLGGLVACWAMNQWLALWQRVVEGEAAPARGRPIGQGGQLAREGPDRRQPPTMHAAAALTQALCRHVPTDREKEGVGQALHYTFGTMTGALYGALVEVAPALTMGGGVPFGLAVWLLADELALPAVGLSQPPTRQALATHTYAFASHCVYGLATECARRVVRRVL